MNRQLSIWSKMPVTEDTDSAFNLNEILIPRGIYSPTIILLHKAVKVQLVSLNQKVMRWM